MISEKGLFVASNQTPITILTFGMSGSGKSTLSNMLASENFFHLNLGKVLRGIAAEDQKHEYYSEIQKSLTTGRMLDSARAFNIVNERMHSICKLDIIFDGFPRYEEARHDFYSLMKLHNRPLENIEILFFAKKTAPKTYESDLARNRAQEFESREYPTYSKLIREHSHLCLPFENGPAHNYTLAKEHLINKYGNRFDR